MPISFVKVARGLLLYGPQIGEDTLRRDDFFKHINVKNGAFRAAGRQLGATMREPGLRFFDSSIQKLEFGPGAGLVLGISVGSASLRGTLVDANGALHHRSESDPAPGQLSIGAGELLDRIRDAAAAVLSPALMDEALLVDGRLPLLGVAIAWGASIDRHKHPIGPALANSWHTGEALDDRVARYLNLPSSRSHALNDTHAAAIAVAFAQTREPGHVDQQSPRLAVVMRLAGAVGGSTIGVERPESDSGHGRTSGFSRSILIGAGEFGHVRMDRAFIAERNESLITGLGPLEARRCSCVEPSQVVPDHLEAYASTSAVARRVAPGESECDVIRRLVHNPSHEIHRRALEDVGVMVGHALRGPVALLNPSTITLTGSLALPTVRNALARRVSDAHVLGREPEVRLLDESSDSDDEATEAKFARAKGAALGVLRRNVYRRLEELLGDKQESVERKVRALTLPLDKLPW